jgi:MoxR-like ATPase
MIRRRELYRVSIGSVVQLKEGGKKYTFIRIELDEESGEKVAILRVEGSSGREYPKPLGTEVLIVEGTYDAATTTAEPPKHKVEESSLEGYTPAGGGPVKLLKVGDIFRWPTTGHFYEVVTDKGDCEFVVKLVKRGHSNAGIVGNTYDWGADADRHVDLFAPEEVVATYDDGTPAMTAPAIDHGPDTDFDRAMREPSVTFSGPKKPTPAPLKPLTVPGTEEVTTGTGTTEKHLPKGAEGPVHGEILPREVYCYDLRVGDVFQNLRISEDAKNVYTVTDVHHVLGAKKADVSVAYDKDGKHVTVGHWTPSEDHVVTLINRASASTTPAPKEEADPMSKMSVLDYVKSQGVTPRQIKQINEFRTNLGMPSNDPDHPKLRAFFFGSKELKLSLAALLGGQHLILKGPKGSGKNTLAETCAFLLARPLAEIQGHAHLDGDSIIGHEVFKSHVRDTKDMVEVYEQLKAEGMTEQAIGGVLAALGKRDEVSYLYGTVAAAARDGKFCVIDEANSVRPEALIITHSLRDDRRRLEIPGYGVVTAHPAFRMILTFNPGYAGTSELNEATADGFVPVYVPPMGQNDFANLLKTKFYRYGLKADKANLLAGIFQDLLKKSGAAGGASEISTRSVSVRAVLQAVELIWQGIPPQEACLTSFVGRTDEELEQKLVGDIVKTRIQSGWGFSDFFTEA